MYNSDYLHRIFFNLPTKNLKCATLTELTAIALKSIPQLKDELTASFYLCFKEQLVFLK